MFGNILNNASVISLVDSGLISIDPFQREKLKLIHYPLTPYTLLKPEGRGNDGEFKVRTIHQYQTDQDYYSFTPNQYLMVEIEEYISVGSGLVGHFIPSSNLIHQGFGLTAGRIEYPFGRGSNGRVKVRFGIKNLLEEANALMKNDLLAYVYFIDLRGLNSHEPKVSERDQLLFDAWKHRRSRFEDEGPKYPE